MQIIEIKTTEGKQSEILIGEDFRNIRNYLPVQNVIVIIDENIFDLYPLFAENFKCIKIHADEKNKTLETVEHIILQLTELQADRSTFIAGVGGGITCDIAGFAASIYMRGLRFGFVSTSLLSQADASVGGKNGVNFYGLKNMIGTFNQPEFVICDINMLDTLPQKEFRGGLSEIIKIALIKDAEMFDFIEDNTATILNRDKTILQKLITKSIQHKADIVGCDEFEKGKRRILNFGHTLAHAIEPNDDISHGFAVSIGMMFAAKVSEHFGFIANNIVERIERLLAQFDLPRCTNIDEKLLFNTIVADKKKNNDAINLVLLNGTGKTVEKNIKINDIEKLISIFCNTTKNSF
ncbi:MAG: 3-dehydroquinate synthase [Prevotellaceae bacterium]|jgi:3-dehydroquinate synthase|nr:3-dehydroquinate synthase [Prevotellaceae bacterium]